MVTTVIHHYQRLQKQQGKRHTNFVQFETPASLKSHDVGEARFNGTARSAIEVNIYCCLLKLSSKAQIW